MVTWFSNNDYWKRSIEEAESSLDIFEPTKHRNANQRYQVMSYRLRLLNRA